MRVVCVPCIMHWKEKIPPGSSCDEIAATIDLLPTIAGLSGVELPNDRTIDGKNIWPLISGKEGAKLPMKFIFSIKEKS